MIDGSFFISHDNMAIHNVMGMYWGNLGASLNWLAHATEKLDFKTTLSFDHFNPRMAMEVMQMNEEMTEYIRTYSINESMQWRPADNHAMDFGFRSALMMVKSGEWTANGAHEREIRSLCENSIWVNYDGNIAGILDVNGGVRLNLSSVLSSPHFYRFQAVSGHHPAITPMTYIDVEPRVSLKFRLSDLHSLKAGIGMASQNLHSIRSSTTSFPFDRYALTSNEVKPERTLQCGAGYSGMTRNGAFDWSAEAYYRRLENVYDYKDGKNSFSDINLQSLILGGKGMGYGIELMVRKNTGRFTGWIAYTLSQTRTKINGINDGRWFNATSDRRHDLALTGIFRLSGTWHLSGTWIYSSGQPLTAPDVKYEISGVTCYYYSRRNSYRTPPTHRLDLSATYTHVGRKLTYEWAFGLYNAYCRYNPYVVYFQDDPDNPSGSRAVLHAMYGLIPSVSYTLKF